MDRLSDILKTINDDEMIAIGSLTNFVFIGYKDELETIIEEIDDCYEKRLSLSLETALFKLQFLKQQKDTAQNKRDIKKLNKRIDDMRYFYSYESGYWPLMKRFVKNSYPSITEDKKIIIIEGHEFGNFWDRTEFIEGCKDIYGKEINTHA